MIRVLLVCGMIILAALGVWQLGKAGLLAAKAWAAPVLIEKAYHQSEQSGKPVFPWPWADSYPVAQMEFPKLGIKRFILSQSNMRNLAFGPVVQKIAAHSIYFAHRDTHFEFLRHVQARDIMKLNEPGKAAKIWQVQKTQIIHKNDLFIPGGLDESLLVLVTCYPFDAVSANSDQRYVAWLTQASDI